MMLRSATPVRPAGDPAASRSVGLSTAVVALVVLYILLLWFGTLDARHLLRSDEGRYAQIAREMFASGDWVTIRYNAVKYFEKPPFHLWVTALSYTLFGVGDWQARLCVALSGMAGLLATMWAAARWYGWRVAGLAGLALVAAPMWNVPGHFNSLDMTLAGALAVVFASMLLAQHPRATPAARLGWMLACWAAMAVAVLTKGLVGIALPGLVLVVYTAITRDWKLWQRLHVLPGLALMLVITVPWFWLVSRRNPEFLYFFFVHEHWLRYTSDIHHRHGPIWYFVPLLLAGFLPWLPLAPGMWRAVRGEAAQARQGEARDGYRPFRPALLAATWATAIFVFFSLSGSKLPGYIVPIFPALALLAGLALDRVDARGWRRLLTVMVVVSALGVAATPIVASLDSDNTPNALYRLFAIWVGVAFVAMLVGVLAAHRLARTRGQLASIVVYALGMYTAFTIALLGHEVMGRRTSGVDLAREIRPVLTESMPLYGVGMLDHTVPFYLRHRLTLVWHPDELEFGLRQEPRLWIPSLEQFEQTWRNGQPAMALMSPEMYTRLQAQALPMYRLAQDARRVVVTNFPPPATTGTEKAAASPGDGHRAPANR